jgi:hypothetical protein
MERRMKRKMKLFPAAQIVHHTRMSLVAVERISQWASQLPVISQPSGAVERRVAISSADRLFSKIGSNSLGLYQNTSTKNCVYLTGSVRQNVDKFIDSVSERQTVRPKLAKSVF